MRFDVKDTRMTYALFFVCKDLISDNDTEGKFQGGRQNLDPWGKKWLDIMTHDGHTRSFCKLHFLWLREENGEKEDLRGNGYFCWPMYKLCDKWERFRIHMNPRSCDMRILSQATGEAGLLYSFLFLFLIERYLFLLFIVVNTIHVVPRLLTPGNTYYI